MILKILKSWKRKTNMEKVELKGNKCDRSVFGKKRKEWKKMKTQLGIKNIKNLAEGEQHIRGPPFLKDPSLMEADSSKPTTKV